MSSRMTTLGS